MLLLFILGIGPSFKSGALHGSIAKGSKREAVFSLKCANN